MPYRLVEFLDGTFAVQKGDDRYFFATVWRDYIQRDGLDSWSVPKYVREYCCFADKIPAATLLKQMIEKESSIFSRESPLKISKVHKYE